MFHMAWVLRKKENASQFDVSQLHHITELLKKFEEFGEDIKILEIDFGANNLCGQIMRDKNGKAVFLPITRG